MSGIIPSTSAAALYVEGLRANAAKRVDLAAKAVDALQALLDVPVSEGMSTFTVEAGAALSGANKVLASARRLAKEER